MPQVQERSARLCRKVARVLLRAKHPVRAGSLPCSPSAPVTTPNLLPWPTPAWAQSRHPGRRSGEQGASTQTGCQPCKHPQLQWSRSGPRLRRQSRWVVTSGKDPSLAPTWGLSHQALFQAAVVFRNVGRFPSTARVPSGDIHTPFFSLPATKFPSHRALSAQRIVTVLSRVTPGSPRTSFLTPFLPVLPHPQSSVTGLSFIRDSASPQNCKIGSSL